MVAEETNRDTHGCWIAPAIVNLSSGSISNICVIKPGPSQYDVSSGKAEETY